MRYRPAAPPFLAISANPQNLNVIPPTRRRQRHSEGRSRRRGPDAPRWCAPGRRLLARYADPFPTPKARACSPASPAR
nr:MAG TPA_asm: hypothetical protein [Caudoviricetes sp.]